MHEYPVITQTFVENEACALEDLGHPVVRYALHPTDGFASNWPSTMTAKSALSDIRSQMALVKMVGCAIARSRAIMRILFAERPRPSDFSRQLFALGHAISMSSQLRQIGVGSFHLHAHFLGRCLDVVTFAEILLEGTVSTSATGHAADARNSASPNRFRIQVQRLSQVICASESVARVLESTTERKASAVIHCGITPRGPAAEERIPSRRLKLLTVARLVEKKGIFDCLSAAEILHSQGVDFEWRFIGTGSLLQPLQAQSQALTEDGRVEWMGIQPPEVVHQQLQQWADVFVLPSKASPNGDVDGIPVALMEAMTSGVAVISSDISGIPELIRHGKTGLLIDPGNVTELVAAIEAMLNPSLRNELTSSAKTYVDREFNQRTEALKLSKVILA